MNDHNDSIIFCANSSWYLYHFRKNTLKRFIDLGYMVYCIAPDDQYKSSLCGLGARFIKISLDGASVGIISECLSILDIFKSLYKLKPVYVFNFTIKMNIYLGLCCSLLNIPYANNVSGLGTAFLHDKWVYRFARRLYGFVNKRAHKVFMQNQEDKEYFVQKGLVNSDEVVLLPGSGIDTQRFAYQGVDFSQPIKFIMIARLIADKGVREYVEAAKLVKQEYSDVRFLLVGPSGVANKTAISHEEVDVWRREGIVEYLGEVEDVQPLIVDSHILVLPSYREGMPRTVLEAASIGRPAIVTDVPGCRQAIKPFETGWLCEVKSSDALADTMRIVLESSAEVLSQMSKNCRSYMEDNFDESIVIDAYVESFSEYRRESIKY